MIVEKISLGERELILIGTAHVSNESKDLVEKTILEEQPDVVGVELDKERFMQLKADTKWGEMNLPEVVKSGKTYLLLVNLLLASIQKKIGKDLGVKPGLEMKQAIDSAEINGVPVALLDREISITLKRAIGKMSLVEKLKLGGSLLMGFLGFGTEQITAEKIDELKNQDTMTALINELSIQMPSIKEVLVDERDKFIASKILLINAPKIVAVVGAGHMNGIKKYLKNPVDIKPLMVVPKKKSILSKIKYLIPLIFVIIIYQAFMAKGINSVLEIFWLWILINGFLSALGALIARAHWKTMIVSFIASPLTSLHPALAAGWFAAITETKIRMPQVKDFESLNKLDSYDDFTKNKVTRILLVAAYVNLGSAIGTLIALPLMLSLL